MRFKGDLICSQCNSKESWFWSKAKDSKVVCFECKNRVETEKKTECLESKKNVEKICEIISEETKEIKNVTRRKTRSCKPNIATKTPSKIKGKKTITLRGPPCSLEAPDPVLKLVTENKVKNKGTYYKRGDIVQIVDIEDKKPYFCQIRGFLIDQYCKKYACITWLFPSNQSPKPTEGFDPSSYIIGYEEDIPRELDALEFVMHSPSEYYFDAKADQHNCVGHTNVRPYPGFNWLNLKTIKNLLYK